LIPDELKTPIGKLPEVLGDELRIGGVVGVVLRAYVGWLIGHPVEIVARVLDAPRRPPRSST
jgi:hypothetical protein